MTSLMMEKKKKKKENIERERPSPSPSPSFTSDNTGESQKKKGSLCSCLLLLLHHHCHHYHYHHHRHHHRHYLLLYQTLRKSWSYGFLRSTPRGSIFPQLEGLLLGPLGVDTVEPGRVVCSLRVPASLTVSS